MHTKWPWKTIIEGAAVLLVLTIILRMFPPPTSADRLEEWIAKHDVVETRLRPGEQWPISELQGHWSSSSDGIDYRLQIDTRDAHIVCEWVVFARSIRPRVLVRQGTYELNGLLRLDRPVCELRQQVAFQDFYTISINDDDSGSKKVIVPAPTVVSAGGIPDDLSNHFVLYKQEPGDEQ